MKHLKTFENINEPQVGDYVICYEDTIDYNLKSFISNNIGTIYKINKIYVNKNKNLECPYIIEYENEKIPNNISISFSIFDDSNIAKRNKRNMREEEIIFFSKYKKDVEAYMQANKYNI